MVVQVRTNLPYDALFLSHPAFRMRSTMLLPMFHLPGRKSELNDGNNHEPKPYLTIVLALAQVLDQGTSLGLNLDPPLVRRLAQYLSVLKPLHHGISCTSMRRPRAKNPIDARHL